MSQSSRQTQNEAKRGGRVKEMRGEQRKVMKRRRKRMKDVCKYRSASRGT
jgi:hypothetical protein